MDFNFSFERVLNALKYSAMGMVGILIVTTIIIGIMMFLVNITSKNSSIRNFFKRTFRRKNK